MKAFFGADLNNVVFQIKPYFVLYQCFMNKTVQNVSISGVTCWVAEILMV